MQSDHDRLTDPLFTWAVLVGRLPAGTSRKQAESQLNVLWWNWRKDVLKTEDHHIGDKDRLAEDASFAAQWSARRPGAGGDVGASR